MFFLGAPSGHDFQFHLASWIDVAGQWREGIFYPRWAEWANWGYGEPRFIFYPPASWMLGAALGSVLPWTAVPVAYIWLVLVGGGMAMWGLASDWLSPVESGAGAVFFALNPYNLVLVYYRSDFAELLAAALFPLLVLAVVRVANEGSRQIPLLALVFAGVWLCNAPAAVIATYSVALLLCVSCGLTQSLRPLFSGAAGMAAGFGISAFYILPAAWEQKWVQIAQVVSDNLRPEQNFIFTHGNDPEFVLFNWKMSSLALGTMLVTGVLAVLVARRKRELNDLFWMLSCMATVSGLLMFSPSRLVWRSLPELRFVQFPWRWLDALAVPFAFFAAAALGPSLRRTSIKQLVLWVALVGMLGGTATAIAKDTWWDSDDPATVAAWVHSGAGYEGTDEYAPLNCDRYALPGVNPDAEQPPQNPIPTYRAFERESEATSPSGGATAHVDQWTSEERIISENSGSAATLAIRIVGYPAWEAEVDGRAMNIGFVDSTCQIRLPVPAGRHRIELRFRKTWDRPAGNWISLLFGIGVLVLWARNRLNE